LISEAQQAESKADFIHKLSVALKEANETDYWINLLFNSGYMERENYYAISADINEILRLLTSIIKTSKQNR
jgi:four helix bundle protein